MNELLAINYAGNLHTRGEYQEARELLAGLIALVPGYGETLRINGRLRVRDEIATLEVQEALLHCAKSIMRSELWTPRGTSEPSDGGEVPGMSSGYTKLTSRGVPGPT